MSISIDRSAALVAPPRERALVAGARLHADDAQPRPENPAMPNAATAWRPTNGSTMRGFQTAAPQGTQDGRTAVAGAAHVTSKQHFSTRSGPPTSRQPA